LNATYLRNNILIDIIMNQVTKGIEEGIKEFTEKYDLEAAVVADLRFLLLNNCKKHVKETKAAPATTSTASKTASGRTRRKTGYNMYIKTQFDDAKASAGSDDAGKENSQALMSKFSKEWRLLSDADKQPFNDKAREVNEASGVETTETKKKTKKKISGYNLFYMQNKDAIKAELAEGQKLMAEVGAQWRALSEDEQREWGVKASEYTEAHATADE
jgi:hypothetical protein